MIGLAWWTWARPEVFGMLPVLGWAWWRLCREPELQARYSGAQRYWQGTAQSAGPTERRKGWPRRFSEWFAWLFALLALAGPQASLEAEASKFRIVVDRSPSMYLAVPEGGTRLERARQALLLELESMRTFEWCAGAQPEDPHSDWPSAWNEAPLDPEPEPDWVRYDAVGTLWLTDHLPNSAPLWAGVVAGGGPAVPGPAALTGGVAWTWLGGETWEPTTAPVRWLVGGEGWPQSWRRLAELWAEERGLQLGGGEPGMPGLELSLADSGTSAGQPFVLEGSGFRVTGRCLPLPPELLARTRHESLGVVEPPGSVLLATEPGRVICAISVLEEVTGDASELGLRLAQIFDAAQRLPASILDRSEREAALGGRIQGVVPPRSGGTSTPRSLGAWFAWVAVLCLLAGLGPRSQVRRLAPKQE